MSNRFSDLTSRRFSSAADRLLSNCWVTVGNSVGLSPFLRPPISTPSVFAPDRNLALRGFFEAPYSIEIGREGVELSVEIEAPVSRDSTRDSPIIRHDDRLGIEVDGVTGSYIYKVTGIRPDGVGRVLFNLNFMGLSVDHPTGFPARVNGRDYSAGVDLDGGPDFIVAGELA